MKQYRIKLTDEKLQTGAGFIEKPFQWKVGQWRRKEAERKNRPLLICTGDVFHCYPKGVFLYSLILNYNHACIKDPVGWLAEVAGKRTDQQYVGDFPSKTKEGYTRMRLVKRIKLPKLTVKAIRNFCDRVGHKLPSKVKTSSHALFYAKNLTLDHEYEMSYIEEALRLALGISQKSYDEMLNP